MRRTRAGLVGLAMVGLLVGGLTNPTAAQGFVEGPDYRFEVFVTNGGPNFRASWDLFGGPEQLPYYIHEHVIAAGYEQAVRNAFNTWQAVPNQRVSFSYQGSTSRLSEIVFANGTFGQPTDGFNVVSFGSLPTGVAGRAGLNGTFAVDGAGNPTGSGVGHFDVTLSTAAQFTVGVAPKRVDVESLMLHEIGHVLGLTHPTSRTQAVMWGNVESNSTKRILDPADVYALQLNYSESAPAARVIHQSTAGVAGAAESGDEFGDALGYGDFNGDGFGDVVVGSPGEAIGTRAQAGAVHVFPGSVSGLNVPASTSFSQSSAGLAGSAEAGDRFGEQLAGGDFNGDGFDDLVVASPGEALGSRTASGVIHVLSGSGSGLRSVGSLVLHQGTPGVPGSAERNDLFGSALAVGDFNGDGRDDLAVGSPGEAVGSLTSAGAVHVFLGSSTGLRASGSVAWSQNSPGIPGTAERNDLFGGALTAGDFNNDGRDDLVIASPGEALGSRTNAGMVAVVSGSFAGLNPFWAKTLHQDTLGVVGSVERNDRFGASLAAGDVNGDGRDDLAVGVPGEALGSRTKAGLVNLFLGGTNGLGPASTVNQDTPNVGGVAEPGDSFGASVHLADVNGDGRADLVVGSPGEAIGSRRRAGMFHVIPGTTAGITGGGSGSSSQQNQLVPGSAETDDRFGSAVLGYDVNGDGRADVVVSSPGEGVGRRSGAGMIHELPAGSAGLPG